MKHLNLSAVIAVGMFALVATAEQIPGLFNTGVDASGTLLDNALEDPHYKLISSVDTNNPGPQLFTLVPGFPVGPWVEEGPVSRWIAPKADQSVGNEPGDYTYRTSVDLTGFDASTVTLDGLFAADNSVKVRLNGVDTSATGAGFGGFATFTLNSGFVAGLNHIDFIVNNAPPGANPTGFRAEMVGDASRISANTPLTIVSQPSTNVDARATGTAVLRVVAQGSAPVSYQWFKDSQPISGANTAELTLTNLQTADAGSYTVRITNAVNSVTSTASTLVVRPALVTVTMRVARITIDGSTGRPHRLDYAEQLTGPGPVTWNSMTNFTLAPNPLQMIDGGSGSAERRFYRAVKLP